MGLAFKVLMARDKRNLTAKKLQDKRILIVEDQPMVSKLLTELLGIYNHLSLATSSKDVFDQIKQAPDVILLDLHHTDMETLQFASLIRSNEKTEHIPILAISGNSMDKRKCLEMGCSDFIRKPFSASTLLVRLAALIPSGSFNQRCPVRVNGRPCGLQIFRTGTLDDSVRPLFDVYECAKKHETYHLRKTND